MTSWEILLRFPPYEDRLVNRMQWQAFSYAHIFPSPSQDYDFVAPPSGYEDVLQSGPKPSSETPRGHQFPAAFLIIASGLDKVSPSHGADLCPIRLTSLFHQQHGIDSSTPVSYTHLDIAGSAGDHPSIPTGAPIPALVRQFIA